MTISATIKEQITLLGRPAAELSKENILELDLEIDKILFDIKVSPTFSAATTSMSELAVLQELLALLLFKYDVALSAKQKAVVRGFDRSDDPELRLAVYDAVKNGRFP